MDVAAIVKIIESGDKIAILLLIPLVAPALSKGLFALSAVRYQRQKEFLELWREVSLRQDALWLEEIFRLRYRAEIAAPLIQHVLSLTHPSAKLRRLAKTSRHFKLDATQSLVVWTKPRRARLSWFLLEWIFGYFSYFICAFVGSFCFYFVWKVRSFDAMGLAFLGLLLLVMAVVSLFQAIALAEARSTLAFVNDRQSPSPFARLRWCISRAMLAIRRVLSLGWKLALPLRAIIDKRRERVGR